MGVKQDVSKKKTGSSKGKDEGADEEWIRRVDTRQDECVCWGRKEAMASGIECRPHNTPGGILLFRACDHVRCGATSGDDAQEQRERGWRTSRHGGDGDGDGAGA